MPEQYNLWSGRRYLNTHSKELKKKITPGRGEFDRVNNFFNIEANATKLDDFS